MRRSLRVRLTLAFALGTVVVLSAFGTFVFYRLGRDLLASVDLGLRARAQVMADAIGAGQAAVIDPGGTLIDPDESFAQVLDARGRIVQASPAVTAAALLSFRTLRPVTRPTFFFRTVPRMDSDPIRLLAVPVSSAGERLFVVVGSTLGDRRDALATLFESLAIGGPVVLILMSTAAWMMVRGALRPVERMRQEAAAISASEPERRLPIGSTADELARLGTTLNAMLDRLQQALERERRFVDDASHELRTPLSILKMELDLALARDRTREELEEALRSASGETERLVRLAQDLLVIARMDHGRLPVHRTEVSMQQLVTTTVSLYAERARAAGARIDVDVQPATASVDPARVRQALENLLDNALRHTPHGGSVVVRVRRAGDAVRISVRDRGPGFPPDLLGRAFEPFARDEADVGEDGSGSGLGLTIVRAVAEGHQGSAAAENVPDGGAQVTLVLRG